MILRSLKIERLFCNKQATLSEMFIRSWHSKCKNLALKSDNCKSFTTMGTPCYMTFIMAATQKNEPRRVKMITMKDDYDNNPEL